IPSNGKQRGAPLKSYGHIDRGRANLASRAALPSRRTNLVRIPALALFLALAPAHVSSGTDGLVVDDQPAATQDVDTSSTHAPAPKNVTDERSGPGSDPQVFVPGHCGPDHDRRYTRLIRQARIEHAGHLAAR